MSPDMKITQVKSNGKSLKNIELPDVMTAIRSGEQATGDIILFNAWRSEHSCDGYSCFAFCRPVQEKGKQDRVSGV